MTDDERSELQLRVWLKTIDTQMHFNEMSVKARQLGLSFVVAALGVSVVLLSQDPALIISITLGSVTLGTHVAGLVIILTAIGLWSVRQLDLNVYHKMLRGAVAFGEEIESKHVVPSITQTEKGLTQAVSHFSRVRDAKIDLSGASSVYVGSKQTTARNKISVFYWSAVLSIAAIGIAVSIVYWDIERAEVGAISSEEILAGEMTERPTE